MHVPKGKLDKFVTGGAKAVIKGHPSYDLA